MDEFVKLLAPDYTLKSFLIKQGCIVLKIQSAKEILRCPYCGKASKKVHSMYEREVQDLPLQDNKTILLVGTRKMFCENENCSHKTFTEHHPFVVKNGKKTERLNQSNSEYFTGNEFGKCLKVIEREMYKCKQKQYM